MHERPLNDGLVVVDASAVVGALRHDGLARRQLAGRSLFAPHLLDLEVANALRGEARGGRLRPAEGALLLRALRALGITRYPVIGLTERIWELRDNLSAYDAAYVAVAEVLDCSLLTADAGLAAAPGVRCPIEFVTV